MRISALPGKLQQEAYRCFRPPSVKWRGLAEIALGVLLRFFLLWVVEDLARLAKLHQVTGAGAG